MSAEGGRRLHARISALSKTSRYVFATADCHPVERAYVCTEYALARGAMQALPELVVTPASRLGGAWAARHQNARRCRIRFPGA